MFGGKDNFMDVHCNIFFFSKNFALLEVHLFITVVIVMSLSTFIMYYKSFPEQTFKIILDLTNNMSP